VQPCIHQTQELVYKTGGQEHGGQWHVCCRRRPIAAQLSEKSQTYCCLRPVHSWTAQLTLQHGGCLVHRKLFARRTRLSDSSKYTSLTIAILGFSCQPTGDPLPHKGPSPSPSCFCTRLATTGVPATSIVVYARSLYVWPLRSLVVAGVGSTHRNTDCRCACGWRHMAALMQRRCISGAYAVRQILGLRAWWNCLAAQCCCWGD